MYWVMIVGLVSGVCVVIAFEAKTMNRAAILAQTTGKRVDDMGDSLQAALSSSVDGVKNMCNFWTGGLLFLQVTKEHLQKSYEMLAIVSALLLSIGVTFYTADATGDKLFGLTCCIANCFLWMATLASAFFSVVINSCEDDKQVDLLTVLYGTRLMRVPMALFVWGSILLFLEFVLYFKLHVDAGFNCSMCLAVCFVVVPLFIHCMHKMGWAAAVVHENTASDRRNARTPSVAELQAHLHTYIESKGAADGLDLDKDEYLALLKSRHHDKVTSTQREFCARIFDAHVNQILEKPVSQALESCLMTGMGSKSEGGRI
jgi:hypothetical protein